MSCRRKSSTATLAEVSFPTKRTISPKWLIYLPPTMSPCETSTLPDFLEHPAEAFAYYRNNGVGRVICEEKHMGSRAVVVACKDSDAARRRFGVADDGNGIILTRTGRRFFDDSVLEGLLLATVRDALDKSDFWAEFATDWVCLDCELMPWSAKAQSLIKQQYAAVGAASQAALAESIGALQAAQSNGIDVQALADRYCTKAEQSEAFVEAYRQYCWPVNDVGDLKLAPFHILATEGKVHTDRNHIWHMETIARICDAVDSAYGILVKTPWLEVDLSDAASEKAAVDWWLKRTQRGGEGMVVKPLDFIVRGKRGLVQPAVKCRGREYLRIIYGPEHTSPDQLNRLRSRGLGRKRGLAMGEFALGIEALERFVRREPLRRVHECVFGVLAMESEPVDPRL
ncbi:MAG: hypothetical protein H6818_00375 [Phycisphaerales bacterium]|nr:hypothetical protein [Phycisphaerales bacterium]